MERSKEMNFYYPRPFDFRYCCYACPCCGGILIHTGIDDADTQYRVCAWCGTAFTEFDSEE